MLELLIVIAFREAAYCTWRGEVNLVMDTRGIPRLYTEPPSFDIELGDFLGLPLRRLDVFRLLRSEGQQTKRGATLSQDDYLDAARLPLFLDGNSERETSTLLRADLASHYILRLACCGRFGGVSHRGGEAVRSSGSQEEELSEEILRYRREWFVRAEKDLFKCRLKRYLEGGGATGPETSQAERSSRLEALRLVYGLRWLRYFEEDRRVEQRASEGCRYRGIEDDKVAVKAGSHELDLVECTAREDGASAAPSTQRACSGTAATAPTARPVKRKNRPTAQVTGNIRWMSCPFERVLPLVRSRQVELRGGQAVLALRQVPVAVVLHFERMLRDGLAVAERALPGVEDDERVRESLEEVRRAVSKFIDSEGSSSWHASAGANRSAVDITCGNIDQIAEMHFPLCMRRTLRVLRREHHLKYQARLQLVSFLANAGMEVTEVLKLWRSEFSKGMKPDEYARKRNSYEYSVRHIYGLEGKRKAFTPLSCWRIAGTGWGSGTGGLGHGCPFKSASLDREHPRVSPHGCRSATGMSGVNDTEVGLAEDSLPGLLASQGLKPGDIEDIVGPLRAGRTSGSSIEWQSRRGGAASTACRKHFVVSHRVTGAAGAVHEGSGIWRRWGGHEQASSPNMWLAASTRLPKSEALTQDEN